jgi:hypothetical protein
VDKQRIELKSHEEPIEYSQHPITGKWGNMYPAIFVFGYGIRLDIGFQLQY